MKRGEIWTTAGGQPYTSKPRPVVIVQDDQFDSNDSITTCPLTSDDTPLNLFRIPIAPTADSGLPNTSHVMADKISTIPRNRLGRRIGHVTRDEIIAIDRAILVFLGLSRGQSR